MENKIKAEIVTHSKRRETGEEIITYRLTFPRIILSEVNTYKMMEKNTSSSRAIPFEKIVEVVEKEPFVPIAWANPHKGMQGNSYYTDPIIVKCKRKRWLEARDAAVLASNNLDIDIIPVEKPICKDKRDVIEGDNYEMVLSKFYNPITKQLKNRLLEPFMWTTQLITGTRESFKHLFEQRCPQYEIDGNAFGKLYYKSKKSAIECCDMNGISNYPQIEDYLAWLKINKGQAEIHFMDLAEKMYDALNESKPVIMEENDWHIPFSDRPEFTPEMSLKDKIILSCAMTARVSYTTINDDEALTLEKAEEIYNKCVEQGHFSVVSHCAKCMTNKEYGSWYKGFIEMKEYIDDFNETKRFYDATDFLNAQGYNKNLKGFISLRQYVEDNEEFKID